MDNNCEQLSGCRGGGGNNGRRGRSRGFSGASEADEDRSGGRNRGGCFRGSDRGGRYRGRNRNENDLSNNVGFIGGRHGRPGTARKYVGSSEKKEVVSNGCRGFCGPKRENMDLVCKYKSNKICIACLTMMILWSGIKIWFIIQFRRRLSKA